MTFQRGPKCVWVEITGPSTWITWIVWRQMISQLWIQTGAHAESCACELFQLLMGAYYIIYIYMCVCVIIYTYTVPLHNHTCVCIYVFIYLSIHIYSDFLIAHVPCIPFATWHTPTLLGCAMHGGPVASAQYLAGLREFLHLSRALSTSNRIPGSMTYHDIPYHTMTCYDCAQVPGIARCEGGRKRPPCGPV